MTGSSNKSAGDQSSLSGVEKKTSDSSTTLDSKVESKMTNAKEKSDDGKDGPLDVIDEDTAELLANSTTAKIVKQEESVSKLPPTGNFEELAICLHPDASDNIKFDDPLVKPEKKDIKEVAKLATTKASANKLTKSPEKSILKNKMIWVYNILPSTKASELKAHFSKHARITTARVVTNGRKYYGCLTVEDEESVKECIKQLNNTIIDGQEIKVQSKAPDNDSDSTEEKQKRTNTNDNNKVLPADPVTKSVRPIKKSGLKSDKSDPLTRSVKSPKRNRSKSKEGQELTHSKRRRSRSNSLEQEARKKLIELRRLTADIEEMQRRKERMIVEEKEKEREHRENERIQEMRRKVEEERAHKRMEIELGNKRLDLERKLLEREREAFTKLKAIEMEELRIRTETKRKIEEAEEYQRSLAIKVSPKERGDRKRSPTNSKRYQENFNDASKQRNRSGNNRSASPNLFLNSQKFDIKPLKRDNNTDKYPPAPKISSSNSYNHREGNKSSSQHTTYYNSKDNRYNSNNVNLTKYSSSGNTVPPNKTGKSVQFGTTKASWLPSALSTSNTYHHSSAQGDANNIPWQQTSNNGTGNLKQLGSRYAGGTGSSAHEQQQQYHHHNHGSVRHQMHYSGQMMEGGAVGGSGRGGGRAQSGGYQGGRKY